MYTPVQADRDFALCIKNPSGRTLPDSVRSGSIDHGGLSSKFPPAAKKPHGMHLHLLLVTFDICGFLLNAMLKVANKPLRPSISDVRKNATENGERPDSVAAGV